MVCVTLHAPFLGLNCTAFPGLWCSDILFTHLCSSLASLPSSFLLVHFSHHIAGAPSVVSPISFSKGSFMWVTLWHMFPYVFLLFSHVLILKANISSIMCKLVPYMEDKDGQVCSVSHTSTFNHRKRVSHKVFASFTQLFSLISGHLKNSGFYSGSYLPTSACLHTRRRKLY